MTLFFGDSERARCIAHPATQEELFETINKFLKEKKYKSYYTRVQTYKPGITCYDVGSWSEFFYSTEQDVPCEEFWSPENAEYKMLDELEQYINGTI